MIEMWIAKIDKEALQEDNAMKWILILTLWLQVTLFGVVRILTFHYNQSDFIELQHKGLKKFLKDDFELISLTTPSQPSQKGD